MMTTVTLLTAVTLMFSASTLLVSCSGGGDTPEKVNPTPTPTTPTNPTPDNPTQPDQPTNPDQPTQPDQPTVPTLPENVEIVLNATSSAINKGSTRATTIDSNTDLQKQDLKIYAYLCGTDSKYLDGVRLHYDASAWKFWNSSTSTQLHYYWPFGMGLDFIGYCPYTTPGYITSGPEYNSGTGVTFSCDVSDYMTLASQASMQEFLFGVAKNQTVETQEANDGVPLQFKHPFALVKFVINAASDTHVQINSISIADLYTSASCTYNGSTMSWGSYDDETKAAMTITQVLKIGGTTESTSFVVIPKNYGTKYLTVNATWDEWSDVTISSYGADVDFNWAPGYIYTYNLTLDKYGLKVNKSQFTEQW